MSASKLRLKETNMTVSLPKICFVGSDAYPVLNPSYGGRYIGGESVQQTLLAREFVRQGFQVSLIDNDFGQPTGTPIHGINILKTFRKDAGIPVLRFLHPRMTSILSALKKANADVYYQSCAGMITGLVAWHCSRYGKKFIFRIAHDTDCIPGRQLIDLWRDRKIYEYGLKRADVIVAQSDKQHDLLNRYMGLDSVCIDMVVEPPTSHHEKRDIDVLWVNNLRGFKRPDLGLELARRLSHRHIVMIGGICKGFEALYQDIEAQAKELSNLDFLGFIPYHDVNNYYSRSKVFVNTSDSEGFPNSFLQAWIRRTPVVSFFDPDDVITSQYLGIRPVDMQEMVKAVEALLLNEDNRKKMGENGHTFVHAKYAPENVIPKYVDIIDQLMSKASWDDKQNFKND